MPTAPPTWKINTFAVPDFESLWHFRREVELTYIRQGTGTRLIGDEAADHALDDLVLIGPNVPHT